MALIRLLLFVLVSVTVINAIKCYTGSDKKGEKKCEAKGKYCLKEVTKDGVTTYTCDDAFDLCDNAKKAGKKVPGCTKDKDGEICCCDKDLCNGAIKTGVVVMLVGMMSLGSVLIGQMDH